MFDVKIRKMNISDEELIADLQRVASFYQKPAITYREYRDAGQFSNGVYVRAFGTWMNALEKAGLGKTFNRNITVDELFENLAKVWVETGKQPTYHSLATSNSNYTAVTYANRFNSWNQALLAFGQWANEANIYQEPLDSSKTLVIKTPRAVNWRLRAQVLMRDGATCQMCGASPQTGARLHVDHIFPWSKGGQTNLENLRILCVQCNIGKGDSIPESDEKE